MKSISNRLTDPKRAPKDVEIARWVGSRGIKCWRQVREFIDENYPGVFSPEWLFGGKKHGWSLRYKRGKSFCTFVPERGRFSLLLVFGREERERVEKIKSGLTPCTREAYQAAATYHDGKWLVLDVHTIQTVRDVERLLAVKRRPEPRKSI
jgi:hypothetical protein